MSTRKILITGATGKQGGAAIKALLTNPPPFDFEILALTRNTSSRAAKALTAEPKVSLVEGDLDQPGAIFTKAGGVGSIWGVFLVTVPSMKKEVEDQEVKQGKELINAAIAHNVGHFVYTSVDRGGPDKSEMNATDVPHFVSKYTVEKYLQQQSKGSGMTYTILRPVAFMDNFTPNFPGRVFAAMWDRMGTKQMQIVATKDIGVFAAQAFTSFETAEYKDTAISLAGDELTRSEANEVFWKTFGRPMPQSYSIFAMLLMKMVPEMRIMFQWFIDEGYRSDINKCRKLNTNMLDFEGWLREESGFKR